MIAACDSACIFYLANEQLKQIITPASGELMLNSLSNPTGAAYAETNFVLLSTFCRSTGMP